MRLFSRSPPWDEPTYWALDLETGGLDAARAPVIAVGMVPIVRGAIRLAEVHRTLVRPVDGSTIAPGSVRAHGLLLAEVEAGPPLAEVLPEVERRLRGNVLLVHHAEIDVAFLRRDFERCGLRWPAPPVVDTVRLLRRLASVSQPGLPGDHESSNLARARAGRGLPAYQAHDALTDAIATAELFLSLRAALGARTLRDLR